MCTRFLFLFTVSIQLLSIVKHWCVPLFTLKSKESFPLFVWRSAAKNLHNTNSQTYPMIVNFLLCCQTNNNCVISKFLDGKHQIS